MAENDNNHDGFVVATFKIAGAATLTWLTWKVLQYAVGHKIDKHIEERARRLNV